MSLGATFDSVLSRVRLAATALDDGTTALFQRSTDGVNWTTVRGGAAVAITGADTAALDDYEFAPGVTNTYRVTAGADTFSTTIAPDQDDVWFKSIARPFLNRAVPLRSINHGDIVTPARNGIFPVIGRSDPIAVTDVRMSRRWTMTVRMPTVIDADALETMLAGGDPLYIQVPPTAYDVPGGYVVVDDVVRARFGTVSPKRTFTLPMTRVAPPGPEVVGSTSTWDTIIAEFGTWAAVLAEFGSWTEVLEHISDPETVIVP